MKCLKELSSRLKRYSPKVVSLGSDELPKVLSADEHIARFIFNTRDMFPNGAAKPKPFMPENGTGVLETSVCRKTRVSEERIWELARKVRHPLVAIARADLGVAVIHKSNLKAHAAPEPEINYHEHSVIVGWPEGEDEKARQKNIAVELAAEAKVIKVPS